MIVRVKDAITREVGEEVKQILLLNVVPEARVRTLLGEAVCVASLLPTWRPFLAMAWAPLYTEACFKQKGILWVKTLRTALLWTNAFLSRAKGTIEKRIDLADFRQTGSKVCLVLDASPFGIGGYMMIDGIPWAFFSEQLTALDHERFGYARGDAAGQQTWEALAVLVALRMWSPLWRKKRVVLTVKSDSVTILVRFKTAGVMPSLIAREIALDVAECVYQPAVVAHIPGKTNVIADELSRINVDEGTLAKNNIVSIPPLLKKAQRWLPPPRDGAYYRTLLPPT